MPSRILTTLLILLTASSLSAAIAPSPVLSVEMPGYGSWTFEDVVSPPVPVQVVAGMPLDVFWSGDASAYGGSIAGYRCGWDLMDPDDTNDPGWTTAGFESDLTGATSPAFAAGVHTLHVVTVDELGSWTRAAFLLDFSGQVPTDVRNWGALKALYGALAR